MSRFRWLMTVAMALPQAAFATDKPNILLILADDLGYGDLGSFGQTVIQTPNLDRLATEGMRLTSFYAGSTVCAPSRCALMTGLHTGHGRVRGNKLIPLLPEDATLPEMLQQQGYRTALIGKWGLGEPETTGLPNRQGFDVFFGYLNQHHAHNYFPDYLWKNTERYSLKNIQSPVDGVAETKLEYSPDLMLREALAFLETSREQPFFLYFASTLPHTNNELGRVTGNGMEILDDAPYHERDWPQQQKNHAAMITRLDRDVGRLLEKLHELNLDDNTLVLFTSDNGPLNEGGGNAEFFHSSGPFRGHKRDLTDGGIRAPTIIRWPGQITAGTDCAEPCANWDLFPTFAEITGGTIPNALDGVSLLPLLKHPQHRLPSRFLYWEFHERGFSQAVRYEQWKAIRLKPSAALELYDVVGDPGETQNVAASHPDLIRTLETYLRTARTSSAEFPTP